MGEYYYAALEVTGDPGVFMPILADHNILELMTEEAAIVYGSWNQYGLAGEGELTGEKISDDVERLTMALYEARYGDYVFEDVVKALTEAGVPWSTFDEGGYDGDPYVVAWQPGMDEPTTKQTDKQQNAVLSEFTFNRAKEHFGLDETALLEWIEGFFTDNPTKWRLPPIGSD